MRFHLTVISPELKMHDVQIIEMASAVRRVFCVLLLVLPIVAREMALENGESWVRSCSPRFWGRRNSDEAEMLSPRHFSH